MSLPAKAFSRIYVETAARAYPLAGRILEQFPRARVVEIGDHREVFGRSRQAFHRQKRVPQMILAVRRSGFLQGGNELQQEGLSSNFRYTNQVLNCLYDCQYCFLQGRFSGAQQVVFVNSADYYSALEGELAGRAEAVEPLRVALSYETDLLAMESRLGMGRDWVEWSRGRKGLLLEFRTKSAPLRFMREGEPHDGVRIGWTLSPEAICARYETGAPSLARRLAAVREAARCGWRILLSLDPLLRVPEWRAVYGEFMEQLGREVPWGAVERVEMGVFRLEPGHYRTMRQRPDTDLLHYPYEHASNAVSYTEEERLELMDFVRARLPAELSPEHLFLWT